MFIGYAEDKTHSCFPEFDVDFNLDGCYSVCQSKGCSAGNSRCVHNGRCCCDCPEIGGYGK